MRVFILLSVVAAAFASQECGENEHYASCGTACPLTCKNYLNPPRFCVKMCVPGCHCDEGYVRSSDGRCVEPEECPARAQGCGENEHFESCGTACPLTCENYQNPPKACVLRCDIGCHCDKGYVRSADGRCVKPEECPARAGAVEKSCTDNPESGLCDAYFKKFYYDAETRTCQKFIYGGCGGNGNRYDTMEECMQNCAGVGASVFRSACDQPAEVGVYRGFFSRYYFDRTTGRCQRFVYGGCGGNENNFETEEECNQNCAGASSAASLCELPAETGPCRARMGRYHFDKRTGSCKLFIYGGCGGNANNFETPEECFKACAY